MTVNGVLVQVSPARDGRVVTGQGSRLAPLLSVIY